MPADQIVSSGGWCAPSASGFDAFIDEVEPERWPAGLTADDLDWVANMLVAAEIDIPATQFWELPSISITRGGLRFPIPPP